MRRRRIKNNLRTIETKSAPPLGEVTVITDVYPNFSDRGIKDWITAIAWLEIKLFPESLRLRDVLLAVLA